MDAIATMDLVPDSTTPESTSFGLAAQHAAHIARRRRLFETRIIPKPEPKPEARMLRPSWTRPRRIELLLNRLVASAITTAIECKRSRYRSRGIIKKSNQYTDHKIIEVVVKVRDIQIAICREYHLTLAQIISEQRGRCIVQPRQLGMYLATRLSAQSMPAIGRVFGGKDHTTVMHARNAVIKRLEVDPELVAISERLIGGLIKQAMGAKDDPE